MTPTERKSVNKILAINTGLVEQNAKLISALKRTQHWISPSDPDAEMIREAIKEATP